MDGLCNSKWLLELKERLEFLEIPQSYRGILGFVLLGMGLGSFLWHLAYRDSILNLTDRMHPKIAEFFRDIGNIYRWAFRTAEDMTSGLTFMWVGAFMLASALTTDNRTDYWPSNQMDDIHIGYWRSILMEMGVGVGVFQAVQASAAHKFETAGLVILTLVGILIVAAGYCSTEYWQEFCIGIGSGFVLFAALEKWFESAKKAAMQGDAEAHEYVRKHHKWLEDLPQPLKVVLREQAPPPSPPKVASQEEALAKLKAAWDTLTEEQRKEFCTRHPT